MIKPVFPETKLFINTPNLKLADFSRIVGPLKEQSTIVGEKSTAYYEHKEVLKSILKFNKSSKIIFIMRNPVERALSNYFYSVKNSIETRSPEEVFLQHLPSPVLAKQISVNPFNYLGRGEYHQHVRNIIEIFSTENILFLQLEKLLHSVHFTSSVSKIEQFLDIGPFFHTVELNEKINAAERTIKIESDIFSYLYEYFDSFNLKLSEIIDIDLSLWQN